MICGLRVHSDFSLPGGIALPYSEFSCADIVVRTGNVPAQVDRPLTSGPNWQFRPPLFLLTVPGVARLSVDDGHLIVVEPIAPATTADAAIFVIGTCLAVALHQRGSLTLHASAVADDRGCYAFSGVSGAGKSSLAALLTMTGDCHPVCDDVTVVDVTDGKPFLYSDGRRFRLWDDVLEQFALGSRRGPPVREGFGKYHVDLAERCMERTPPLRAIYMLDALPAGSTPAIDILSTLDALAELDANLYRRTLLSGLGRQAEQFVLITRLLQTVPVFRLKRPVEATANPAVISLLKRHWDSLE